MNRLCLEDALKRGECVFPVKGVSMMPMLVQEKDTVLVVRPCGNLKKYDLALYKKGDSYYLHRIISVKKDYYVICGDNCIQKEKVPFSNIIGVAKGFYKNGEYISCKNEAYLKYAKKRSRNRWRRAIARKTVYVFKRLFGKK